MAKAKSTTSKIPPHCDGCGKGIGSVKDGNRLLCFACAARKAKGK